MSICDMPHREKNEIMRSKKIKLYPTIEQKIILKHWFGSRRWVYNQCLNYINQKNGKIPIMQELRSHFLNGKSLQEFSNGTPYDIRDGGMRDLLKNYKSNIAKVKSKAITHFKLTFQRSKFSQSIAVPHKFYGTTGKYSILKNMNKSEPEEKVLRQINHDFRILKDNNGDYWICLPVKKTSRSERQVREFSNDRLDGTISLDPGVRTFLVGYDGQNTNVLHFGTDASKKIEYVCMRLDLLISRSSKEPQRKRVSLRKAIKRLRKRIENMVTDMHYKVANFLCENYKTIKIPVFKSRVMVQSGKLNSKVARRMMNLSHYLFKTRLLSVSEEYKNCKVEIVGEEFTSQTCGKCGTLNKELGISKLFKCVNPKCRIEIDRDINGARNILLKNY
jgi:putative transposase